MRIHYLQHVPFEDLANIAPWAAARGYSLRRTALFAGEPLPVTDDMDALIVMGGPMGICDDAQYPWLADEKACIRAAIDAGKKVLGVCLGAQLIADVLGAPVTKNPEPEIGWFDLERSVAAQDVPAFAALPRRFPALHWHGDTFAIPDGAIHLARSEACVNQAFSYGGHVLALQFHLESSAESAERLLTHCSHELVEAPFVQKAEAIREGCSLYGEVIHVLMAALLDSFFADGVLNPALGQGCILIT